jgi:hypothetical protein
MAPVLVGHLEQREWLGDSGVRADDVDAAESLDARRDRAATRLRIGLVGDEREAPVAGQDLHAFLLVDGDDVRVLVE